MSHYEITGGRPLTGSLTIQGAKNSVLPILSATLLCKGTTAIHNCPQLSDVTATIEILRLLGCNVTQDGRTITVDATNVIRTDIPSHLMQEMRSSVIFMGALLARCGQVELCTPGGCQLGSRPIDLHLSGLKQLGAKILEQGDRIVCNGTHMDGGELYLPFPSVGATENLMLAACGCEKTTTIVGAAREPEIEDLQNFINAMGGCVCGAGSSIITIKGGCPFHETEHDVIGDRIVAATYLCATAAAGGFIRLDGIDPAHLSSIVHVLRECGCEVDTGQGEIALRRENPIKGVSPIRTAPYPGYPTDAQAILMGALAVGQGSTMFAENMFDSRYHHVDELRRMGADIQMDGRVAMMVGVQQLKGAHLYGNDLRGTAGLVVAALGAQGISHVSGLSYVRRGYENFDGDLRRLGAQIETVIT